MKKLLELVRVDKKYCDYLRQFDDKVPYNFDKKELRPFVGVLFYILGTMSVWSVNIM